MIIDGRGQGGLTYCESGGHTELLHDDVQYAAAGIKLIVSVFGSTDAPTSSGADPVSTANNIAAWVKEYDLDGVDVDYEVRPCPTYAYNCRW